MSAEVISELVAAGITSVIRIETQVANTLAAGNSRRPGSHRSPLHKYKVQNPRIRQETSIVTASSIYQQMYTLAIAIG